MVQRGVLVVAIAVAAFLGADAMACEPIHKLKLFDSSSSGCQDEQLICEDQSGGPPADDPINCRSCSGGGLCWASDCRGFGAGDSGQFGQFKKDAKGELEALVMTITNETTGAVTVLVDQIANPDCAIPTPTAGVGCSALYKVRTVKPDGEGRRAPLCTWNNLDDINTIARTPKSAGIFLTDLNGKSCKARKKVGDQWWMYYQTCCNPLSAFGNVGEDITTTVTMILDKDGVCSSNDVRHASEPETIPEENNEPCV